MKTDEMADLLDGFVLFAEKMSAKSSLNDIRSVSNCLRQFPGETVATFCKFIAEARTGKPARTRSGSKIDPTNVEAMAMRVNHFLENKRSYDYTQIDTMVDEFNELSLPELRAVGEQIEGPTSPRTKSAMLKAWRSWLRRIKLSDEESASRFSEAAAGS